jgi:hypothetical protein
LLCKEPRMIAQKFERSKPGSFSASTSSFVVRVS